MKLNFLVLILKMSLFLRKVQIVTVSKKLKMFKKHLKEKTI